MTTDAMQGYVREQDPGRIGTALHERFIMMEQGGTLITPEQSASVLLEHIRGCGNGETWVVLPVPAAPATPQSESLTRRPI